MERREEKDKYRMTEKARSNPGLGNDKLKKRRRWSLKKKKGKIMKRVHRRKSGGAGVTGHSDT